ncbi:unnamed protein product [Cyprideis torosa]|uniref:Uncharacterized protein n=1 Tax=Cyprideis torosa TaxID=163714 RepID=A0A7R8WQB9_9CRUS|nr:unnamed protein product [Cyprideis torosa]CAG0902320.1 unnamed protein product [Cyprideis torosa]
MHAGGGRSSARPADTAVEELTPSNKSVFVVFRSTTSQGRFNSEHKPNPLLLGSEDVKLLKEPVATSSEAPDVASFVSLDDSGALGEDVDCDLGLLSSDTAKANLKDRLRQWKIKNNVKHSVVDPLLKILSDYHPGLPKCSKTLMSTARAFLFAHVSHNHSVGCPFCIAKATWVDHVMTFPCKAGILRTDADFRQETQPEFHRSDTPLLLLEGLDLVNNVPVEPMHCIYQGVTKRFIQFMKGDASKVPRMFTASTESRMDRQLDLIAKSQPKEFFARKPRYLSQYKNFKATELRMFACYTGLGMLYQVRECLDAELLKAYNCLLVACHVLSWQNRTEADYGILQEAIQSFFNVQCFPSKFWTLNAHLFQHLPHFCRLYGSINDFSAFQFESALGLLKHYFSGFSKPLQQIDRRLAESHDILGGPYLTPKRKLLHPNLKKATTYSLLSGDYIMIDSFSADQAIGFMYEGLSDLFMNPVESSRIGIVEAKTLKSAAVVIPVDELARICWAMPFREALLPVEESFSHVIEDVISKKRAAEATAGFFEEKIKLFGTTMVNMKKRDHEQPERVLHPESKTDLQQNMSLGKETFGSEWTADESDEEMQDFRKNVASPGRQSEQTPTSSHKRSSKIFSTNERKIAKLSPRFSHLTPTSSHLTPTSSHLTPTSSHLTPTSSHLTPIPLPSTPTSSHLTPVPSPSTPTSSPSNPISSFPALASKSAIGAVGALESFALQEVVNMQTTLNVKVDAVLAQNRQILHLLNALVSKEELVYNPSRALTVENLQEMTCGFQSNGGTLAIVKIIKHYGLRTVPAILSHLISSEVAAKITMSEKKQKTNVKEKSLDSLGFMDLFVAPASLLSNEIPCSPPRSSASFLSPASQIHKVNFSTSSAPRKVDIVDTTSPCCPSASCPSSPSPRLFHDPSLPVVPFVPRSPFLPLVPSPSLLYSGPPPLF